MRAAKRLKTSELETTHTELNAKAAPAKTGFRQLEDQGALFSSDKGLL